MKRVGCFVLAALVAAPSAQGSSRDFEKLAIIAGLGLVAAGAESAARSRRTEMVARRGETSFPEFDRESRVRPGEAVFAAYNFEAVEVARTTERTYSKEGYPVAAGTAFYRMINGKFCDARGKNCFDDKDGDGDLDKAGRERETTRRVDVRYERGEVHFDASADGFRSELVFQGVGGGVLFFAYREFVDDMARPAFTQEIRYDLQGSSTLAFQDLEIDVLDVGNMGIRYVVRGPDS